MFSFLTDGAVRNNLKENTTSALSEHFSSLNLVNEKKSMESQLSKKDNISEELEETKENNMPANEEGLLEVYVKWEASKDYPGKFITKLKVSKTSNLADLRKLIEGRLHEEENNKQAFTFLMLGDPTGAPVVSEKEVTTPVGKLPICNNQISSHFACLRAVKKPSQQANHLPLSSLENKLSVAMNNTFMMNQGEGFSPKVGQKLSSSPFVTGLRI